MRAVPRSALLTWHILLLSVSLSFHSTFGTVPRAGNGSLWFPFSTSSNFLVQFSCYFSSILPALRYLLRMLFYCVYVCIGLFVCLFVTDKLCSILSTPHMIHTPNQHDSESALVNNSFALTVFWEVPVWRKLRSEKRKLVQFTFSVL